MKAMSTVSAASRGGPLVGFLGGFAEWRIAADGTGSPAIWY